MNVPEENFALRLSFVNGVAERNQCNACYVENGIILTWSLHWWAAMKVAFKPFKLYHD